MYSHFWRIEFLEKKAKLAYKIYMYKIKWDVEWWILYIKTMKKVQTRIYIY